MFQLTNWLYVNYQRSKSMLIFKITNKFCSWVQSKIAQINFQKSRILKLFHSNIELVGLPLQKKVTTLTKLSWEKTKPKILHPKKLLLSSNTTMGLVIEFVLATTLPIFSHFLLLFLLLTQLYKTKQEHLMQKTKRQY